LKYISKAVAMRIIVAANAAIIRIGDGGVFVGVEVGATVGLGVEVGVELGADEDPKA
jgi:hypothetical protein